MRLFASPSCSALAVALLASCVVQNGSGRAPLGPTAPESTEQAVLFHAATNASGDGAMFTLENRGDQPIAYWGYSAELPQLWVERKTEGAWEETGWDWCGTGLEVQQLAPGAAVIFEFSFRDDPRPLRLATFVFDPEAPQTREKIWSNAAAPRR